tara:strand:- start:120 stop:599 length:480 start_codon:yes stop_codon:yes gene_type:complete
MTNAWSLLYDEMEHSKYHYEYGENSLNAYPYGISTATESDYQDFWENSDTLAQPTNLNMEKPHFWKYQEDLTLKEIRDYLSGTYRSHYTSEDSKTQTLDLIESIGDAEPFCRSNAIKYLSRFGKKDGKSKQDILKAIHYCILLYHFSGLHKKTGEPYPQ